MLRERFFFLRILATIQFILCMALSPASLAQEWKIRAKPRGILKVVDLGHAPQSAKLNCTETLINKDKNNNWVPGLAEDWRWVDDRTIDFKLREGVRFHNGETFDAKAVEVNWMQYRKMENPWPWKFAYLPDETTLEIIDTYNVRFILPQPDGMAMVKFWSFSQMAPAFFTKHKFPELYWGYLPEAGPWGSGPFKLVEGSLTLFGASERVILESFAQYWDRRYPKVERVVFDNVLIGDRNEAVRLCREKEGAVDIVSHIRPLDTLKVAKSPYAKIVKSKDVTALEGLYNLRKRNSRFRDIRLRNALNYAVNREELWKYGAKGNAYNLGGFIPPAAFGRNPDIELYHYDIEKAKALLAEAGFPNGFEVNILATEMQELETQIICRMLERIGLKPITRILSLAESLKEFVISLLDRPPEEIEWDLFLFNCRDWWANPGLSFLPWGYVEESDTRWIERDPVYEAMWNKMIKTVNPENQEERIRQMVKYLYDNAYCLFIYSPITLYAVNKEVNLLPYRSCYVRLKETWVTDNHWSVRGKNN